MIEATQFIPLAIIAVTQVLKMAIPGIQGFITIIVALLVGVLVALLDTHIGINDITVAQGFMFAAEAVGITVLFKKASATA